MDVMTCRSTGDSGFLSYGFDDFFTFSIKKELYLLLRLSTGAMFAKKKLHCLLQVQLVVQLWLGLCGRRRERQRVLC